MRAKEFIIKESNGAAGSKGLKPDQITSIPNAHFFPDLDNSSGYKQYRFGVAMAGMPDFPMNPEGPSGQKTVAIGYTSADDIIIDSTSQMMGARKVRLTPIGSTELNDTGVKSPVADWQKSPQNKK